MDKIKIIEKYVKAAFKEGNKSVEAAFGSLSSQLENFQSNFKEMAEQILQQLHKHDRQNQSQYYEDMKKREYYSTEYTYFKTNSSNFLQDHVSNFKLYNEVTHTFLIAFR